MPIVLFVTIALRRPNPHHCLDNAEFMEALVTAWWRAVEWRPGYFMIMPDHLHLFAVPGQTERISVKRWCQKWKGLVSAQLWPHEWKWLPGCWDTQMRSEAHYREKMSYVRLNPVRKGLVLEPDDWPYQGTVSTIRW